MNNVDRSFVQPNYCLISNVTFGSPSKNCRGHGICSVIPAHFLEKRKGFYAKLILEKTNTLCFEFKTIDLPKDIIQRYFTGQFFRLPEKVPLPFIAPFLGFNQLIYIPVGLYRWERNKDWIRIYTPVKPHEKNQKNLNKEKNQLERRFNNSVLL